jgi:protein tyrosine phosphatase (PTP) superfamily phosphohydrolase (DUF442 family)
MNPKDQHEDEALTELVDELIARGRQATIVRRPDRDKQDSGLTVDAIISIDGQAWAFDHFILSRPPDLPPARAAGERELQPRLDAVARAASVGLFVSYLPHSKEKYSQQEIQDYYDHVVSIAEEAAKTGSFVGSDDGFTTADTFPGPPAANLAPFSDTGASVWLGDQVEAGIKATLESKLSGQLARAKALGYPVGILIDQIPRPGKQSTVWLASPTGIARVVQAVLSRHPGVVGQVWLRPAQKAKIYLAPPVHLLIA